MNAACFATSPGSCARSRRSCMWRKRCRRWACPAMHKASRRLKAMGFSDKRLAQLTKQSEAAGGAARHCHRASQSCSPVYKPRGHVCGRVSPPTPTAYMYSSYETGGCESRPTDAKKATSSWVAGRTGSVQGHNEFVYVLLPRRVRVRRDWALGPSW